MGAAALSPRRVRKTRKRDAVLAGCGVEPSGCGRGSRAGDGVPERGTRDCPIRQRRPGVNRKRDCRMRARVPERLRWVEDERRRTSRRRRASARVAFESPLQTLSTRFAESRRRIALREPPRRNGASRDAEGGSRRGTRHSARRTLASARRARGSAGDDADSFQGERACRQVSVGVRGDDADVRRCTVDSRRGDGDRLYVAGDWRGDDGD